MVAIIPQSPTDKGVGTMTTPFTLNEYSQAEESARRTASSSSTVPPMFCITV